MSSAINPLMDKWEMSLMNSLNFSQLFLHLITLGNYNYQYIKILWIYIK